MNYNAAINFTCYWMVFDPAVQGRSWSAWSSGHDLPREKMFRAGKLVDRFVGGVLKSNDNITSWQMSNTGLPANTIATHIILDPQSPVGNRTLYVAACGKGVYKSIDNSIQIIKKMSDDVQKHEYKLESLAKITLGDNNVRFY